MNLEITHIGGPTALIEDRGLAAADRSDVRPSGQGQEEIERELAGAPEAIRERIRWLPMGSEPQSLPEGLSPL